MDDEGSALSQSLRRPLQWIAVAVIMMVVMAIIIGPLTHNIQSPRDGPPGMGDAHNIYLAMFQYAVDHNGAYPKGKSSTEVFQKLINEGYASDPAIFWDESLKIPGKVKPTSKVLQPENVCWDVTVPLDEFTSDKWNVPTSPDDRSLGDSSSDSVPLIFTTGYRISYVADGGAMPLSSLSRGNLAGLYVLYHSGSARFMKNDGPPDGIVPHLIDSKIDLAGKKYEQLTPDGVLGP